jgi:uroporphyrinogen-III synthase
MSRPPRIAITRTLPEAEATAEHLRALGAVPIVAPLLTIAPRSFEIDLAGAQALAFTSINGVRALAAASPERRLPAFCVGLATASAAEAEGYKNVRAGAGDVAALADLIVETLSPKAGPIVHISGEHVAGDLIGALTAAGFAVERRIAYGAEAATTLPVGLAAPVDIILFYSARAAEAFLALGAPNATEMIAACMSHGVAEKAARTKWKDIVVARAPREDALFQAIGLS